MLNENSSLEASSVVPASLNKNTLPLIVSNCIALLLLFCLIIPGPWMAEVKFVVGCLSVMCIVIGLYNIGVEGSDNRMVFSLGLSSIGISFMATVGALIFH